MVGKRYGISKVHIAVLERGGILYKVRENHGNPTYRLKFDLLHPPRWCCLKEPCNCTIFIMHIASHQQVCKNMHCLMNLGKVVWEICLKCCWSVV